MASFGWGEHPSQFTLSTTEVTDDTASSFETGHDSIRSATSHTGGDYYAEVKILAVGGQTLVGVMDDTSSGSALHTYLGSFSQSAGLDDYTGTAYTTGADFTGSSLGGAFVLSVNDIVGICFSSGKVWVTKNGVALTGDPVAKTGNPITVANTHNVFAAISMSSGTCSAQLITLAAAQTYRPSGYSAWSPPDAAAPSLLTVSSNLRW